MGSGVGSSWLVSIVNVGALVDVLSLSLGGSVASASPDSARGVGKVRTEVH